MRAGREPGRAHVADDLLLANARSDIESLRKPREMAVAGPDAVGVPNFDQVAVAAIAAGDEDDAIGGGAHRRPIRRRVIGPLVRSPLFENRMEAPAEAARDMAEAQRRAQEGAAQGAATIVVEPASTGGAIEGEGETGRARHVDTGGENATEPLLALGRLQPLDQDLDAVPRPQIAREVHFPVVNVGNGPGERDTLADGKERVGDRVVECVVQIRLYDGGGAEPLDRPGDLFDRLRPL